MAREKKKSKPKPRAKPRAKKASPPIATPTKLKSEIPAPPPKELAELGAAAADPLEAQSQIYRALVLSFMDAAKDEELSPRERRKEMRTIAAAAAKVFPDARRWEAVQLIKEHQDALEHAKVRRGAKLEPIPDPPELDADASA